MVREVEKRVASERMRETGGCSILGCCERERGWYFLSFTKYTVVVAIAVVDIVVVITAAADSVAVAV